MTYSLHPDAEQDVVNALDFYVEQAGLLVAQRFLSEFEHAVQLLVEYPYSGKSGRNGRRVFPLRVFPFLIVYQSFETSVRILVVRHQHRKPGFGSARI